MASNSAAIKAAKWVKAAKFKLAKTAKLASLSLLFFSPIVFSPNAFISAAQAAENAPEWRYSVRPGDTLIQFSKQYLINPSDWRQLQTLNQIKNPLRLKAGQQLRVPLSLVKQQPASAEIVFIAGNVQVKSTDAKTTTAALNQQLSVGAELITSENSRVDIKFADGSIVSLDANSVLKLDTLSMYSGGGMVDTKLRLQQGNVDVEANPKHEIGHQMQIITPSAVAAVRGTKFRVSADGNVVRQATIEGKVGLSTSGDEVAVSKGFGTAAKGNEPPLKPVLLLAAPAVNGLPKLVETQTASFNLAAQKDAVAWVGKLATDAKFDAVVAKKPSENNHLVFADLKDGQYFLALRAQDKNGIEGYDATHTFTVNAQPFAPKASAPSAAQIIREANPTFAWAAVSDAKSYQLDLAKDAEFKQMISSKKVTEPQAKLDAPLQAGQYYWRLASIDGADVGPLSTANTFTYKPAPSKPDVSKIDIKVVRNQVFVNATKPPADMRYEARLSNEMNQQKDVWNVKNLDGNFNFLLREYGKQTLSLRFVEPDGTAGEEAIVDFNAFAP
jgi:hypothetical protein